MDWVTTSTLLERLRDPDDAHAWADFVGHFREAVVGFARRRGLDEPGAQDVAQNTLMAFVTSYQAGQYQPGRGRLRAWLFGIASNQLRMAHRRRRRDRLVPVGDLTASPTAGSVAAAAQQRAVELSLSEQRALWEAAWREGLMRNCLERVRQHVSDDTFQIFRILSRGEESPAQLARRLGVPRSRVDNAKSRVMARLRACVGRFEDA